MMKAMRCVSPHPADGWRNDDRLDSSGPCGLPDPTGLLEFCFDLVKCRSPWSDAFLRWFCLVPEMWRKASVSSAVELVRPPQNLSSGGILPVPGSCLSEQK